ncbi:MAG: GNAT family N-acetyltransferase [Myxococcota bacterium]
MQIATLCERAPIERMLRRSAPAQIYALADLDDAFWPDTRWYATRGDDGELAAFCLVLEKLALPIVYAVAPPHDRATLELAGALVPRLPRRFFANFPIGYREAFAATHEIEPHGEYAKMWLADPSALAAAQRPDVARLGPEHAGEIEAFFAERAYAADERHSRFFARYMLELAPWFGIREAGQLVSIAGVHVFSQRYGVAALGNVATVPARRGRGLARAVCARLASELAARVPLVGLNVASANTPALRCYRALGFREALRYEEAVLTLRADSL